MKTVVIGGGLAGVLAAKKLNATLITNKEEFVFLPRLPELIRKNPPKTILNIRDCHKDTIIADPKVDLKNNTVKAGDQEIAYDEIIIATGAKPNAPIAGVKTYAHNLYSHEDADKLKQATDKYIIVMGAGPTGVETAMELARNNEVLLLQRPQHILKTFGSRTRSYAHKRLREAGVQVITNDACTRITSKHVISQHNKYGYDLAVWAGGLQANTPKGLDNKPIPVNKHLQIQGHDNAWAIGDCARSGSPLTAQAAQQEALHAVKNIKRKHKNKPLKTFHYHSKGDFLLLGNQAVMDSFIHLQGKLPAVIRNAYYDAQMRRYQL